MLNLEDTVLCEDLHEIIQLNAGSYKSYLWQPGAEISKDISISKKGIYSIVVTTFDSCSATDTFLVKDKCPPIILIPNVFTINGDGINDAYDIEIKGETEYNLKIFNRWGELIYESNTDGIDNDGINWNGKVFNTGNECPEGVYYVLFNYRFPDSGPGVHKGEVTLIRK